MTRREPDYDVAVIGAGVVGLAVAARLAGACWSVLVVERRDGPGRETSSRNSEVIHAGIYYPEGSLRARHCVRGNRLLYELCERRGVAHRALGKLIVATGADDVDGLARLARRGTDNGAPALRLLERAELAALEPAVRAAGALLSPSTGIIDTHGLIKTLEADARGAGADVVYDCRVSAIDAVAGGYTLRLVNPSGAEPVCARTVVNAAGLDADRVAEMAGLAGVYRLHWCKGDYFAVSGRAARLVSRLVYPVPSERMVGLGIHVTLNLAGGMRLGPDTIYVTGPRERCSLDVDPGKAEPFWRAVAPFLPELPLAALHPDMAGLRPKTQGPGQPWRDFVICEESARGLPGLVNLIGIDSPGLTSCLSIAEHVEQLLSPHA